MIATSDYLFKILLVSDSLWIKVDLPNGAIAAFRPAFDAGRNFKLEHVAKGKNVVVLTLSSGGTWPEFMSTDVREKGSSVYMATKAALQGFAEALRKEVNELGIKVSLIEPGAVDTDMQVFSHLIPLNFSNFAKNRFHVLYFIRLITCFISSPGKSAF